MGAVRCVARTFSVAVVLTAVFAGCGARDAGRATGATRQSGASDAHAAAERIDLEPEAVTCEAPLKVIESEECSGGACVGAEDGTVPAGHECGGSVTVPFVVESEGTHILWARCRWADNCGDSFYLTMDGGPRRKFGQLGAEGEWLWLKGPSYPLAAGEHELVIGGREDGAQLDKILLTADDTLAPEGTDG